MYLIMHNLSDNSDINCFNLKLNEICQYRNFNWQFYVVPVMKVMDGFGRNLADQFYKAGSSLEIVCEVINFIN